MPGRTEGPEADVEWSDASEDVVKSGSATDGDKEEVAARLGGRPSLLSTFPTPTLTATSVLSSSLHRRDPVHSVLDKIDAELAAMSGTGTPPQTSKFPSRSSTSCKKSLPPLLPKSSSLKTGHRWQNGAGTEHKVAWSAEVLTDTGLTDVATDDDGGAAQQAMDEMISDLDSVVAQQIDSRFKEIMMKKKVSQRPPHLPSKSTRSFLHPNGLTHPPAPASSLYPSHLTSSASTTTTTVSPTPSGPGVSGSGLGSGSRPFSFAGAGYGTDNESIMTEDFEHRFQALMVMTDDSASPTAGARGGGWGGGGGGGHESGDRPAPSPPLGSRSVRWSLMTPVSQAGPDIASTAAAAATTVAISCSISSSSLLSVVQTSSGLGSAAFPPRTGTSYATSTSPSTTTTNSLGGEVVAGTTPRLPRPQTPSLGGGLGLGLGSGSSASTSLGSPNRSRSSSLPGIRSGAVMTTSATHTTATLTSASASDVGEGPRGGGYEGGITSASAKTGLVGQTAAKGRVSFEDSARENANEKTSAVRTSGLNRVLQHTMKSLGETTDKEPEDVISRIASLPPAGTPLSGNQDRLQSPTSRPFSSNDNQDFEMASEEIERQSARIQQEMERERRTRSLSPARDLLTSSSYTSLPPRPARPSSASRIQSKATAGITSGSRGSELLTVPNLGLHMDNAEKVIVGQELKTLRGALLATKSQLQEAEKDTRQTREKAEEARSELMLLDFKRTTATKDLSRLLEDLERKKAASQRYDQELEAKRAQLSGLEALGLSNDEVRALQEEIASLRQRQRGVEALQLERDELGRQLEAAKGDLLREQRQARLHREEMSEEMETLTARLDETQHAHAAVEQQLLKLEAAYRKMEREKNALIQEQSKEYNALKSLATQESKESRQLMSKEVENLNKELQSLQVRFSDLQSEVRVKDETNNELREQVAVLTNEVAKEQAARVTVTEDHRRTLQMLRKETDSAMLQLRESLFLDKQRAMEELRAQVEQERRSSSARTEERMAHVMAENAQLLADKNQEISRLQEKVRDMQELLHSAERRNQDKTDQQVREAVARERAAIDKETEWKMRNERETLARDTKQRFNEMQMAFDHEREANQRLNREIAQLKEELEEQKRLSREAAKEKLVAVAKTKDQLREQTTVEVESAKEKVRQEMQREVDRVQGQLKTAEEELRGLRADNHRLASREREQALSQDRTEKTVINEINEECRRSASVLGVSPRQVHLSNLSESGSSRSQITTALANLRALNEELRKHVQELTSEIDRCRSRMAALEKEKEDSVESVRVEMEKQRTSELEKLKENLMKEHREELSKVAQAGARQTVANSMINALRRKDGEIEELKKALAQGREQAAEKYAHLYKTELAQELEKSQELLHRSNQEQKQINDIQQREISRLEKEVQKLALALSGSRQDYLSSSPPSQPTSFTDTALDLYLQMQSRNDQPASAPPSQPHHHHHHHHPQVSQQQQQQLLQARIKQLNSENNALRRKHLLSKHNVSVPDLTSLTSSPLPSSPRRCLSPGPGEKMRSLEERLRQGEKEALKAEERARLKQAVMSEKMAEMNKLQNTLASQNQELLKLEQAYSQLHRQYNNSPSLAVATILSSNR